MKTSESKSLLLSFGVEREVSTPLNLYIKEMDLGMKYLGYFLTPNNYRVAGWNWLVQKFEKRISNWSYRWLTMVGRLVLVKFVLEGLHV